VCGAKLTPNEDPRDGSTIFGDSAMLVDDSGDAIDHGSFLPGTIIAGRYRIVALLGRGGMGEVYRADDLKLGQTVALKFLPASLAKDPRRRDRFHREVRVARQVAHPNVCRMYDVGEVRGHTYLSMEYVDGENLSSLLRRIGRVPHAKAIEIAHHICAGLAAAHERGVVHRDFKPANIMIDGRGKARITDFGLAVFTDDAAPAAGRVGTPPYMSPEQLNGQECTVRSDIYALGLVLYELFTGKRAFEADSAEDFQRLHLEATPVRPTRIVGHIEPAIEQVILQCLEKDPQRRPNSALGVASVLPGGDPLAAALAAGETPSPELVAATAPREGLRAGVAVACLLVVLLGIAVIPFLNDQMRLHAFVTLKKPPAVLIDRAEQIAAALGYSQRPADRAYGFEVNKAYLQAIEARDHSPTRWATLAIGRPAGMTFWYRQSPRSLAPRNLLGTITVDDPPPLVPDMLSVRLDPQGRLLSLQAVPPRNEFALGPPIEPDWSLLFREAQLSADRLRPSSPQRVPPVYCNRRAAWVGTYPENPDVTLRVEAAAYRGTPVYFEILPEGSHTAARRKEGAPAGLRAEQLLDVVLALVCVAGAAALARRNLMLGRGDRRGAFRVALLPGAALMVAWALQANHVPHAVEELRLLATAAGFSLLSGGICWLLYIALEPYARQRWPDMLIPWSRLLAARFHDPVVGRDLLIGGLFGILGLLLTALLYFAPGWLGAPPPRPSAGSMVSFLGLRYELAQALQLLTRAVLEPMFLLLLLVLVLVVVRKRWLAIAVFFIVSTIVTSLITLPPGGNLYLNTAVYGTIVAALLVLLTRFGLLAVMIARLYFLLLETYPITANLEAWYVSSSFFALFIAGGLAFYGFSAALAGQRRLVPRPA
jgi:serine/threonine-protein kinase